MHDTTIIETPADKPEVNVPDANLLKQLARIQREQRNIDAVKAWLADHHQSLVGLPWHVSPVDGEIVIAGYFPEPATARPREIAARFPGAWKCGVECVYGTHFLDWVAERNGITIRIQAAEKVEPCPVRPLIATF